MGGRRKLECIFIGVHAFGKLDAITFNTRCHQGFGNLVCAAFACFVTVIGNQDTRYLVMLKGGKMVIGKSFNAVAGSHIVVACMPEGHGIHQRFTQNDFTHTLQAAFIPNAAMRPWQIQMQRWIDAFRDLAAINFGHIARRVKHRYHQTAVEVFMAAVTQNARVL